MYPFGFMGILTLSLEMCNVINYQSENPSTAHLVYSKLHDKVE